MKIDLTKINLESFMVHPHEVCGEPMWLIQPQHINCKWTFENKIFRSSLWDNDGNLVSAGFFKFPNLGEAPDTFPVPTDLKNAVITNKLDGSLLIVSKWNGNYILRTRGTVDATKFENGYELEIFKETILPKLQPGSDDGLGTDTWNVSYLFEWLTAVQDKQIVIKYDTVPDWILIGAVNHNDYSLLTQGELNAFASTIGFKRPEQFKFNTVDELINAVTAWKNQEGVVLYTNGGQSLHKVKSDDYKKKHAFKSEASLENTLELYLNFGRPSFNIFKEKIGELYDWECVQMVVGHMSNICDASKEVDKIITGMQRFVDLTLKPLPTRKDQAVHVIASYSNSSRASFVFALLDGKQLTNEQVKKLFWQVLKK